MNLARVFNRRLASLAALTAAAVVSIATSPVQWRLSARATGAPIVLAPGERAASRHFVVHANGAAANAEQLRQWGALRFDATVTPTVTGGAARFRLVADGQAAGRTPTWTTGASPAPFASAAPRCAAGNPCSQGYTLHVERTDGATSALTVAWTVGATVGNRGESDPPRGAAVTVAMGP